MLSQKLKELRKELGLTQKEFGELLGISSNTIARYERGEMTPQHPQVLEMALDYIRLKPTPQLRKNLEMLAMSKEELAARI